MTLTGVPTTAVVGDLIQYLGDGSMFMLENKLSEGVWEASRLVMRVEKE